MNQNVKGDIVNSIENFRLPKYNEIPNVGLYLEQTSKYISEYLEPLQQGSVTCSMISNYVKKNLLKNPVKKQYDREQIAYLIFIAVAKMVVSMDDMKLLLDLQKKTYSAEEAYTYFASEFKSVIDYVFGLNPHLNEIGEDFTMEKKLLRNIIVTVAHKVYLDKSFLFMHENNIK